MGNLTEECNFNKESLCKLRANIGTKYVENKIMIECEKVRAAVHEYGVEMTLNRAKNQLEGISSELCAFKKEFETRNYRLEQLSKDAQDFNYENHQMGIDMTILKLSKEAWEDLVGAKSFEKLQEIDVLHLEADGLYRMKERLVEGEEELKCINSVMKSDIERLKKDLNHYQSKWLQNAEVIEKIGQVLEQSLIERNLEVKSNGNEADMEEEEEDRYARQHSGDELSVEEDRSELYGDEEEDNNESNQSDCISDGGS